MKLKLMDLESYRKYRLGTRKKAGTKGKPGSKMAKRFVRARLREAIRAARIARNKGGALRHTALVPQIW